MRAGWVVVLVLAAGTAGLIRGSAQRERGGVPVSADAAAHHGAMTVYGKLARWAGARALEAEARYWEAVA